MSNDQPKLTPLGVFVVLLFILGSIGAGVYFLVLGKEKSPEDEGPNNPTATAKTDAGNNQPSSNNASATIGIAYGTEKKEWLKWAHEEFKKTEAGKRITVKLIGMGSLEGGQAVVAQNKNIHVWSPASAAYTDEFRNEWKSKGNTNEPILSSDRLVMSPMVFIMWKNRYDAFTKKYGEVSFDTLRQALAEPTGWAAIDNHPEWGFFKFGHTNPNKSNSGMVTLLLEAHEFHKKSQGLAMQDIVNSDFQTWFRSLETKALRPFPSSTGSMVEEMILKAPASYDVVMAYENLALDWMDAAKSRTNTGGFHLIYPERNFWNDNPYYILDVPWSSDAQRKAAQEFLDFLRSDRIQAEAVNKGFRPANLKVSMKGSESPFVKHAAAGVKLDLNNIVEAPKSDIIFNLRHSWKQANSDR